VYTSAAGRSPASASAPAVEKGGGLQNKKLQIIKQKKHNLDVEMLL